MVGKCNHTNSCIFSETNIIQSMKILIFLCGLLLPGACLVSQDSLFNAHVLDHTYHFDIVDNKFVGPGTEILNQAYNEHQYVMLGEYHMSPLISKFTAASIPLLDKAGFEHVAFEVGPYGLEKFLDALKGQADIHKALTNFHTQYGYHSSDGYYETMIPFFDFYEDGDFLKMILDKEWQIYGVDQEYQNGTTMLLDLMFEKMSQSDQQRLNKMHLMAKDTVSLYNQLAAEISSYPERGILNSQFLKEYFEELSRLPENQKVVGGIMKSMEIYGLAYIHRKWYDSFITRLSHFKQNLNEQMKLNNFDRTKDKMFIKIGGLHAYKGTSAYECFDLGNTIHELAEMNGSKSLHMHFSSRYYQEEGEYFDEGTNVNDPLYDLTKLGKKDQWTIIDLRPFRAKMLFYPQQYKVNPRLRREIVSYDFFIITKEDYEGKPYVKGK